MQSLGIFLEYDPSFSSQQMIGKLVYRVAKKKNDSQCGPNLTKFTDIMR